MDIRLDMVLGVDSNMQRNIFSGGAPFLASIRLLGLTLQSCFPPLTALTSLQLHYPYAPIPTASLRYMLTGLAGLTDLVINGEFYTDWTAVGIIELPSLRTLRICTHNESDQIPGLLQAISAPGLHSLVLEKLISNEIEEFATLNTTATTPKYPSLRFLTIELYKVSQDQPLSLSHWRVLMCAFPTVTHFFMSYDDIDSFLRILNRQNPAESPPLWPELHTLTFFDKFGFIQTDMIGAVSARINAELLGTAVSARIALGHPVRRIRLSKGILSTIADELEGLRAQVEINECTMFPEITDDDNIIG
jgi:hypothetical protein